MRVGLIASIMFAALAGAGVAGAGPREPFTPDPSLNEPDEIVEPVVWSKRLLGRFKFDGSIFHDECVEPDGGGICTSINDWVESIEGKGDCVDFAEGPGLQCVINVVWPERWRETGQTQLGGVSDLTPAMVLAGFVTSTAGGIRVLLVNDRGLAHPGALTLKGSSAIARPPCVNQPGLMVCEQKFKVEAKPDARNIYVTLSARTAFIRSKLDRKQFLDAGEKATEKGEEWIEVSFALRRDAQDTEAAATPAPSASR